MAYDKKIKDLDEASRPREKALRLGFESLSDAELMAMIFGTGIPGKNVVDLCQEIIDEEGGLSKVLELGTTRFDAVNILKRKYKGVGEVKALTLLAAVQLGARAAKDAVVTNKTQITTSELAHKAMHHRFLHICHEEFWILLLDRGGRIIRDVCISKGGTAATTVDVKLIMRAALDSMASSIILFHNHPSGTLRPSPEDDRLTKKIVDAARLMDIRVNDHIIVTSSPDYFSYAEQGRI